MPPESRTSSFVIRIWLEGAEGEAGEAVWRGHIVHLLDGDERYVQTLDEVTAFLQGYLERMVARRGAR